MKTINQFNYEEEVKKCKAINDVLGDDGLIKKIVKLTMESMLEGELSEHLGYQKYSRTTTKKENSRNGSYNKQVRSALGELDISMPRDRNSEFEPKIIQKHQSDIDGFDDKIIAMYARGMSTRDIQAQIYEIYGVEISPATVSIITDKVLELAQEWQNRPLAEIYAFVYFDAIFYKVRENGKIVSKAVHTCLGIDMGGKKEILGLWIATSEGAHYWMSIFNELKNRGVKDILIACIDGLKGMTQALDSAFPKTEVQLCIVHLIRNSLKYVPSKHQAEFLQDLKEIYYAPSEISAKNALDKLSEKWSRKYEFAIKPWIENWDNICAYFKYPEEIKRIMYTTNMIESMHRQLRKATKTRSILAHDDSLFKVLFLAIRNIEKSWNRTICNWPAILSQLIFVFQERANHE